MKNVKKWIAQLPALILSIILTFLIAILRGWISTFMWAWFAPKFLPTIPILPLISAVIFFLFLNLLGLLSTPQKYPAQGWWDYLRGIGQSLVMNTGAPFFLAWAARYFLGYFHLA